jgi:hypothetical protein
MANELQNKSPADTYKDVLQLGTATTSTTGTGLPATTGQIVYDGAGVPTKLKLSQSKIEADNIFITNGTISSLATPLALASGGTGGTTTAAVKALWGIDNVENTTLSTWAGTSNIDTVGTISSGVWGGDMISVSKGGTGGSTTAAVKALWGIDNVENTTLSTWAGTSNIDTVGTISSGVWGASTIPVSKGGTGAITAPAARLALGLGTLALQDTGAVNITGGSISNIALVSPSISGISSLTVDTIVIGSDTIVHSTPSTYISIPHIINTAIVSESVDTAKIDAVRDAGSTPLDPTVAIGQYLSETEDLLNITNSDIVSTCKVTSTGTIKGTQLATADHASFRNASESVNFGSTSQYSVATGTLDTVQSHDSKFTAANIAVGDVIRIKASAGGTWEVKEVKSITSASYLVLTEDLTNTYTNTTYFERISSAATEKMAVKNDGTVEIDGGGYNTGHLVLGAYHLWVDSTGDLRMKNSAPTSDTDGSIVGTQS